MALEIREKKKLLEARTEPEMPLVSNREEDECQIPLANPNSIHIQQASYIITCVNVLLLGLGQMIQQSYIIHLCWIILENDPTKYTMFLSLNHAYMMKGAMYLAYTMQSNKFNCFEYRIRGGQER